jgi:hypothetical protein
MTVKQQIEPIDADYQLIKAKRDEFHQLYMDAETDDNRLKYQFKKQGLDLAMTIIKQHRSNK